MLGLFSSCSISWKSALSISSMAHAPTSKNTSCGIPSDVVSGDVLVAVLDSQAGIQRTERFRLGLSLAPAHRARHELLPDSVMRRVAVAIPQTDVAGELLGGEETHERGEQPRADPAAADDDDLLNESHG